MKKKLEMIQALSECIAEFEWMKHYHKDQRYQAAIDLCSALLAGLVLWIAIGQRQGEQQAYLSALLDQSAVPGNN